MTPTLSPTSNPIANLPDFLASPLGQEYARLVSGNAYTERLAKIRLVTETALDPIRRRSSRADILQMPQNGTRLNKIGNISLPASNTTNNVILSYQVPVGHYGFINFIMHGYYGTGFKEGSGDLTWRILFGGTNQGGGSSYPYYQYGNMKFTIGSLQNPQWAVGGGLPIRENQWILYTVDVSTSSVVAANGQVAASILGWIAPL